VAEGAFREVPYGSTLNGTLGLEHLEVGPELARGRFVVEDRVRQPYGIVHGGTYAAIAESLASAATHEGVFGDGMLAMGMSNSTSFLRPVFGGTVESEARPVHRGRTTWLWDVEHRDEQRRLCAASRVTIAVRPAPPDVVAPASISD
jgi:1,4-dihydroxy-2-naphthoyl-CoA hydrolase